MSDAPDWEKIAAASAGVAEQRHEHAKIASDFMADFKTWNKTEQLVCITLLILIVDPKGGAELLGHLLGGKP